MIKIKKIVLFLILFFSLPILANGKVVTLDRCIDGDTARFITSRGSESTRFLAIDTPETVHPTKPEELFGKEASDFTCNQLKNASIIRLEFDENSDMYDRYDRLLAWVFVDDSLLQELIIKEGLGEVAYLYGDYKYTNILFEAEEHAKRNNLNIWSDFQEEELAFDVVYLVYGYFSFFLVNVFYFKVKPNNSAVVTKIYKRKNYRFLMLFLYSISVVFVLSDFAIFVNQLTKYKNKIFNN